MADAYPASTFLGSDYHDGSIDQARQRAGEAGVADRVTFEVASAQTFAGGPYDLVTTFDALHDMGDPLGAATPRARGAGAGRHLDDRRAVRRATRWPTT